MQEVLLKSLPYLPQFDNAKALAVWLYKVAKNRCLMSRRKSKFAPDHELSLEELMPDRKELEKLDGGETVNPEAFAIRGEQRGRLRSIMRTLPPQYRIVLVLRDMEGLTDEEVAEITPAPGNRSRPPSPGAPVRAKRTDCAKRARQESQSCWKIVKKCGSPRSSRPVQEDVCGAV